MKKLFVTFIVIIIGVVSCNFGSVAYATSTENVNSSYIDYNGEIDIITGLPKNVAEEEDTGTTSVVALTNGVTYDGSTGFYKYPVTGGTFNSTACDGMVLTDAVAFALEADNENVSVYKDGEKLASIPETVSEVGVYSVVTWTDNAEDRVMTFEIVNKVTGKISNYVMPERFNIKSVYLNGKEVKTSKGSVDLSEEGDYEINYRCIDTRVGYTLYITVDHTPPVVSFEGLDSKNRANGPVTITGYSESDTVSITLYDSDDKEDEDNQIKLNYKSQLVNPGTYHVVVSDPAGNSVTKNFTILVYFNLKAWVFLVILVLVIIGLCVALLISRKKLKVR
ncbi:MAG: hypothetical protein K5656_01555 [Lachnospiraceae bacterium]|nr:hypothetical protein [Lachnospiraceae bacterium]